MMLQYQTEAILISVRDFGDADKMVTLFSREYGKITAFAYGARRPKNRLSGGMQLFTHLEATLAAGRNYDTIKQCEIQNPFRHIREDLECLAYGMFIAEMVMELCPERQPEPKIFELLQDVLPVLTERNPRIVALACAWQMLAFSGYLPDMGICGLCGQPIKGAGIYYDMHRGSVCMSCGEKVSLATDERLRAFILSLLTMDWKNLSSFTVNGMVLLQAEKAVMDRLLHCLDRPLKSVDFIKKITHMQGL
jgi:DNA repair protein RecO (recombination protein O)